AEGAGLGGRLDHDRHAVHLDGTLVYAMDAADARDQGRFAGSFDPEQGQDLAPMDLKIDVVEGEHGAESLGRAADGQRRDRRRRHERAASMTWKRLSRYPRRTSASTARTMTTPMTISWKKASTPSRFMPLRMTPIM